MAETKKAPAKKATKEVVAQEETTPQRELTFGEVLIGTEFTTDQVDPIRIVKMLSADLANHMITVSNPEGGEISPLKADLIRSATSQIVLAQMAAVKVMTFEH
jgi:hypothetical protein